jgi:hypothetical protein
MKKRLNITIDDYLYDQLHEISNISNDFNISAFIQALIKLALETDIFDK